MPIPHNLPLNYHLVREFHVAPQPEKFRWVHSCLSFATLRVWSRARQGLFSLITANADPPLVLVSSDSCTRAHVFMMPSVHLVKCFRMGKPKSLQLCFLRQNTATDETRHVFLPFGNYVLLLPLFWTWDTPPRPHFPAATRRKSPLQQDRSRMRHS